MLIHYNLALFGMKHLAIIMMLLLDSIMMEIQEQSKGNIANRERMYTKHRCGSRSIPVRVEKLIGLGWHF
ncbi:hypothetical protein CsSME_00045669 [Camellia sinensis var. sinensis]